MSTCISPGCCTCPRMKRCPGCGYTKHDKEFWCDHYLCDVQQKRDKAKRKKKEKQS